MPYFVAAGAGAALWVATTMLTGRREAWDASAYWTYAYPAGLFIAAAIGFAARAARPWKIGLSMMLAQAVALAFFARSFTLLPLGLVLFGLLAAPVAFSARFGHAIATRITGAQSRTGSQPQ